MYTHISKIDIISIHFQKGTTMPLNLVQIRNSIKAEFCFLILVVITFITCCLNKNASLWSYLQQLLYWTALYCPSPLPTLQQRAPAAGP